MISFQDFKFGGTPLHWAKSKEILEALLDAGCIIDAKNFQVSIALFLFLLIPQPFCSNIFFS
jgi:calcium-independent phospholipase A2